MNDDPNKIEMITMNTNPRIKSSENRRKEMKTIKEVMKILRMRIMSRIIKKKQ